MSLSNSDPLLTETLPPALLGYGARVLIASDSSVIRQAVQETLDKAGYATTIVTSTDGVMRAIYDAPPDLFIADLQASKIDSLGLTNYVKTEAKDFIPVLLLASQGTTPERIAGLTAGADDYLTQPLNYIDLLVRAAALIRIRNLTAEAQHHRADLIVANAHLEKIASVDALTGTLTRRACSGHLRAAVEAVRTTGGSCGLLIADIDHFKAINDKWGHPTGDLVLVEVAEAMMRVLRPGDVIGRWGGEEFCVVLYGQDPPVEAIAERLRRAVQTLNARAEDGTHIPVTISIGGVKAPPSTQTSDGSDLVRLADRTMYTAKRRGRSQVVMASCAA